MPIDKQTADFLRSLGLGEILLDEATENLIRDFDEIIKGPRPIDLKNRRITDANLLIGIELGTISINKKNSKGETLLHYCAKSDAKDVIDYIKFAHKHKADANITDEDQLTPLHHAVVRKDNPLCDEITDLLLQCKANPNAANPSTKETPFHYAAAYGNVYAVTRFIGISAAFGLTIDPRSNEGFTPLHIAAMAGKEEIIKILIEAKADKDAKTNDGKTAVSLSLTKKKLRSFVTLVNLGAEVSDNDLAMANNYIALPPRDLIREDFPIFKSTVERLNQVKQKHQPPSGEASSSAAKRLAQFLYQQASNRSKP